MAKASTAPVPEAAPPTVKKGGLITWVMLGVLGVLAIGGGLVVPRFLLHGTPGSAAPSHRSGKVAFVPFGDVVVNIHEERLTRYLRAKIILVVDEEEEKKMLEELPKKKAVLKNWLIGYLCDRSLQEVRGAASINRLRREI